MQIPDPLVIVIAVVVIGFVIGSFRRFANRVMRGAKPAAGVVVVVWVISHLAGIDLPYLP